jgi:hypothetical protein
MAVKFHQGEYSPKNPSKYQGKYPIFYRSGWEKKFMMVCDERPDIIRWSSESLAIQYQHPFKGRLARYFPDFIVDIRDKAGKVHRYLIEIKPEKETGQPIKKPRQRTKTWMYSEATWAINKAKWTAAEEFCKHNGMQFKLITERQLFNRER